MSSEKLADDVLSACSCLSRRDFLRSGLMGLGISAGLPSVLQQTAWALTAQAMDKGETRHPNRIMVVLELTGGNDGLDTVVPYGHDEYYRARPTLGIPRGELLKLNDEFGLHPQLLGIEGLFKNGHMAVIHGCGYDNPNLSHFKSMEFWHTGVPNGSDSRGWVGRFADAYRPTPVDNLIVNVSPQQLLAVKSSVHAPIVFSDPDKFTRKGMEEVAGPMGDVNRARATENPTLEFLRGIAETGRKSSKAVQHACAEYNTTVNYGAGRSLANGLRNIIALISSGFEAQIYYVNYGGWDTHSSQTSARRTLVGFFDDAVSGFWQDLERIGRADDVAMMIFTEFGRRVEENASGGTDHGTATPMFILGKQVRGGLYGQHPSLSDLDDGNLKVTTDFRRVYATMVNGWMGYEDTGSILKGQFKPFDVFA